MARLNSLQMGTSSPRIVSLPLDLAREEKPARPSPLGTQGESSRNKVANRQGHGGNHPHVCNALTYLILHKLYYPAAVPGSRAAKASASGKSAVWDWITSPVGMAGV